MSTVIKVENLSKQYRLGTIGTGTLSHDMNRWWHRVRGKEDPYLKVSQLNDRTSKESSGYVWALQDINFEIAKGDVVGIIGRNGAGKSTLLKILSRTTLPTTGSIRVKGRIASLLEVGTGFHPELTGRENIYLNGTILGMRRAEIKSKFDEIVDFAGVDKYIDTPVKRYSSGMYVRLAFAVAAHLDPEILIVDEVLAVGDAEFQRKALGKMQSVSESDGRTVLFVSHNMGAIKTLCKQGILLKNGNIFYSGSASDTVQRYIDSNIDKEMQIENLKSSCNRIELITPYLSTSKGNRSHIFAYGEEITLNFDLTFFEKIIDIEVGYAVMSALSDRIFTSHLKDDKTFNFPDYLDGKVRLSTKLNIPTLAPGNYYIIYGVRDETGKTVIYSEKNVPFEISKIESRETGNGILWHTTSWQLTK